MLFMLPGVIIRLATRGAWRLGLMPQSTYVRDIVKALKRDDLDGAVALYLLSVSRRQPSNITEVARELIEQFIDIRVDKLQKRIDEIESALMAGRSLRARIRRAWDRVAGLFGGKQSPERERESELKAELAEHRAMVEGLLSIRARLTDAG
ncbi:MAG: hypothetical protein GX183_09840 [Firmicutes bacterium]|nr:hypothetical protein [Bacillota bacterium]